MDDRADLVAGVTARLEPLEVDSARARADASVHADDATQARRVAADLALSDALADANSFDALRAAADVEPTDAATARQLVLLRDAFVPHQVPAELRRATVELQVAVESAFARHRGVVGGRPVDDNEIKLILRSSNDSGERREAWEASKTVGAVVADDVRQLAHLRNRAAREVGFRDHFALALATSELDEARLFATLAEVDRTTDAPFREWKSALDERLSARFGCAVDDLRPWHLDDPFFQSPPSDTAVDLDPVFEDRDLTELTVRTFAAIDLDIAGIASRSDLYPRAEKNQHAFCIDIDRAGDVRVLTNVVLNEQWMETLLHEFGHAAYFAEVDRALPWFLRSMHALTTEGIAMLFGRLTRDPRWLREVAGVPASEVVELVPALAASRRSALLVFARWVLVMTTFERSLYAAPDGDHDRTWWDLVEQYQLVRRPDGRAHPDWAAKIHVAVAPVYYQNYLYGELFVSQVAATLRERAGGLVDKPAAGSLLRDHVFRPGHAPRWDHLVEAATGSPLSPRHLAHDLSA